MRRRDLERWVSEGYYLIWGTVELSNDVEMFDLPGGIFYICPRNTRTSLKLFTRDGDAPLEASVPRSVLKWYRTGRGWYKKEED